MYGSEQCHHDVDSFLAGGTRLLRVEHSDQMIALFDEDQELEVELAMVGDEVELRTSRGGEAVLTTDDASCVFQEPYTLIWLDLSDGTIQYGTYDETTRQRSNPCLTFQLPKDHPVKYISFGRQDAEWDVAHHSIIDEKSIYHELISKVLGP